MDWDKIRVFHAVAQAGSFTHAGDALNLSQSAVSRQISTLEKSMEVTLFHRHARGLILTEQGELLYRTAKDLSSRLSMTVGRIKESTERPQGPLRVTTTVAFGSVWLTSRMKAFLETYPDIDMSLMLADDELDLSMRAADIAIRMIPPRQPDLIQRHLMTMRYHVFATPDYLKKHGVPKTPQDLDHHQIIVYGEEARPPRQHQSQLVAGGRRQGRRQAPTGAQGEQRLRHIPRRAERPRHCSDSRLHEPGIGRPR